jgi:hypothetical protein
MGGVGSRSKEGWGEARLGKEVQMLSGLSHISDLMSVGVGGWIDTGGAVRSSSPSLPFSRQSWRFSRNLETVWPDWAKNISYVKTYVLFKDTIMNLFVNSFMFFRQTLRFFNILLV